MPKLRNGLSNDPYNVDTVIVGAGPIGLLTAIALKTLYPENHIVILEKYNTYQRKHTLIMQAEQLESLIHRVGINNKKLNDLLTKLQQDQHIPTNELQITLEEVSRDLGIVKMIKEIKPTDKIETLYPHVKQIIGADGVKGAVNNIYFGDKNKDKTSLDYALQIRFETSGQSKTGSAQLIELMLTTGVIFREHVGRYDEEQKKSHVTVQCIISKESFDKLRFATSKHPYYPFRNHSTHKDLPKEINRVVERYFQYRTNLEPGFSYNDVRLSVNEASVTRAKERIRRTDNATVMLVGDAQLGLSYFKGLNAAIEALTELMGLMKTDPSTYIEEYEKWFREFSLKKIQEVTDFSKYKVKFLKRVVESVEQLIKMSGGQVTEYMAEFENRTRAFAQRHNISFLNAHLDRIIPFQHDQLGVPDTPIRSVLKIKKLLVDFAKPYKTFWHVRKDLFLPFSAVRNILAGTNKLIVGFLLKGVIYKILSGIFFKTPMQSFKEQSNWLLDGIARLMQGVFELACVMALPLRLITRAIATHVYNQPRIESNAQFVKYVELVSEELKKSELSEQELLTLYSTCLDLHRKYKKALVKKQQKTSLDKDREQEYWDQINEAPTQELVKEAINRYIQHLQPSGDTDSQSYKGKEQALKGSWHIG